HHIHILAASARRVSVDLSGLADEKALITKLRSFATARAPGTAIRAIGYDERAAGLPDATTLDTWLPDYPLRIQDRTGALWLLNAAMLARLGKGLYPDCVELGDGGVPTGRIWRGDAWLRDRLGTEMPDIAALAQELVSHGITGVTDTGPSNGPAEARLFEAAIARGDWPLQLCLMGHETLPESPHYTRGPLKLHYDEHALPSLEEVVARISAARVQRRAVAAHCVTEAELVWYLTALDAAGGARRGDRIEHGGLIPPVLIGQIADMGLTVVTNPGFIHGRGDRYLRDIAADQHADLYRFRSLLEAGIRIGVGSDAPYGPYDPWAIIRAARDRRTVQGAMLGCDEAVSAQNALFALHYDFSLSRQRSIVAGESADIVLMRGTYRDILNEPVAERVAATIIGARIVHVAR
ncbi:MAG: amidohydrolase family protein, partial [Alphaproteobacteria bacterium]|nr:amidohydrolase family protein [Alphaproteobacteria bacterium]